ncbi:MAG: type II toxin-antitoxin system PemK/MazF family toxin [Planctomycetota bacterium]
MVRRGEIWWAETGDNVGSEVSNRRPVLVVQSNAINRSAFNTVVVIGITSNVTYADIPGNVFIEKKEKLLPKDSVIVCANMAAVDKSRFIEKISELPDLWMDQVEFGISIALDLK